MFAMQLGCLIDDTLPAFQYNKRDLMRPILNVGVILDGCPQIIPMFTNEAGRWIGKVP
jgi:hypothetical protein